MLNSLEELQELAIEKRDLKRNSHEELRVCIGSSCAALNADDLLKDLKKSVKERKISIQSLPKIAQIKILEKQIHSSSCMCDEKTTKKIRFSSPAAMYER